MEKLITILGSTGSIGTQALGIIENTDYRVYALCAGANTRLLKTQIDRFHPRYAVVADEKSAVDLEGCTGDTKVLSGREAVLEIASHKVDLVLSAIVGIAGLRPTLCAINAGNDVALANKETLVTAGTLVMETARKKNVRILPVDSEHSAVFQCLDGKDLSQLNKIILTASGGPFFGMTKEQLSSVTCAQALDHPQWVMGKKISIDSATMMNKGLEEIEAVHLFGVKPEQIEVLIHPQSIVHSLVEWNDGAQIAQLGLPDMRLPIQYALTYPNRVRYSSYSLSLADAGHLTFSRPDREAFPCLSACENAVCSGGLYPAAANGANERAVHLFLDGKIGFNDIGRIVCGVLENEFPKSYTALEEVEQTDARARGLASEIAGV